MALPMRAQSVEDGAALAARLLNQYPQLAISVVSGEAFTKPGGIEILGAMSPTPIAVFILPDEEWRKLSKTEQVSLTLYVESRITAIRESPEKYALTSKRSPVHEREIAAIRNIDKEAWCVGSAKSYPDDPGRNLYLDARLVEGDVAWAANGGRRGAKASDFRK
jgi:hypothetical protein